MGNSGFIAYDPALAKEKFNADLIATIYYKKLLRYDEILKKDEDGFFTRSAHQLEIATCITRRQQERVRRWLESHQYIVTVVKAPYGKTAPQIHFKIVDRNKG